MNNSGVRPGEEQADTVPPVDKSNLFCFEADSITLGGVDEDFKAATIAKPASREMAAEGISLEPAIFTSAGESGYIRQATAPAFAALSQRTADFPVSLKRMRTVLPLTAGLTFASPSSLMLFSSAVMSISEKCPVN